MPGPNPFEDFRFPEPVELEPLEPYQGVDNNYGGYEEVYGGEQGNEPRLEILPEGAGGGTGGDLRAFRPYDLTEESGVWSCSITPGIVLDSHVRNANFTDSCGWNSSGEQSNAIQTRIPTIGGVVIVDPQCGSAGSAWSRPRLSLPGVPSFAYVRFRTDDHGNIIAWDSSGGDVVSVVASTTELNSVHHIPPDADGVGTEGEYYWLIAEFCQDTADEVRIIHRHQSNLQWQEAFVMANYDGVPGSRIYDKFDCMEDEFKLRRVHGCYALTDTEITGTIDLDFDAANVGEAPATSGALAAEVYLDSDGISCGQQARYRRITTSPDYDPPQIFPVQNGDRIELKGNAVNRKLRWFKCDVPSHSDATAEFVAVWEDGLLTSKGAGETGYPALDIIAGCDSSGDSGITTVTGGFGLIATGTTTTVDLDFDAENVGTGTADVYVDSAGVEVDSHPARFRRLAQTTQNLEPQITPFKNGNNVEIRGNNVDGSVIWQECDSSGALVTVEWRDGLVITGGNQIIKAGCDSAGAGGAPTSASYVTINSEASLTAERSLAVAANELSLLDGGANSAVTLGIADDATFPGAIGVTLPLKGTTGDPAGTNGRIYYNNVDHVFRGYRAGAWAGFGDFNNNGENSGVNRTLGNLDAFDLGFITGGTTRIHIEGDGVGSTAGFVGIGTATPSAHLEVVGRIGITGTGESVWIGNAAGDSDDGSTNRSVGIGENALTAQTNGLGNIAVGWGTLAANLTGSNSTAVGHESLTSNTASDNTALGSGSSQLNVGGTGNVAIGRSALANNVSGNEHVAVGKGALQAATSSSLTAVGFDALKGNVAATRNTAVGYKAGDAIVGGSFNVAMGDNALGTNISGQYNTAVGSAAMSLATGSENTAVGGGNVLNSNTGTGNTGVGYDALQGNTGGNFNTGIGRSALSDSTSSENAALGYGSLSNITTGGSNTGVGFSAGEFITGGVTSNLTGSNSIFIGANTRANADGETNQIVIGDAVTGAGANTVTIGNDSITRTDLKGTVTSANGIIGSRDDAITLGVAATTFATASNFQTITGDGGGNTIATITGGTVGQVLTLLFVDANVTITDDDGHTADTIDLDAPFTSADDATLTLVHDGTSWYEKSRSTPPIVYETMFVGAREMVAFATNGATWEVITLSPSGNEIMVETFAFNTTTSQGVGFWWTLPEGFSGTELQMKFHWTINAGTTGQNVKWDTAARAWGDSEALVASVGSKSTVTDASITVNDMHISNWLGTNLAPAGTPTGCEPIWIEITRDVTVGSDQDDDAHLIGVTIEYPVVIQTTSASGIT